MKPWRGGEVQGGIGVIMREGGSPPDNKVRERDLLEY